MKSKTTFKVIPLNAAEKYTRLIKEGESSRRLKSGYVNLKPGEEVGEHSTEQKEEVVIFLEGAAEVFVENQSAAKVTSQTAIYVPPQTRHNIKNIGPTNLRYVFTVTPVSE